MRPNHPPRRMPGTVTAVRSFSPQQTQAPTTTAQAPAHTTATATTTTTTTSTTTTETTTTLPQPDLSAHSQGVLDASADGETLLARAIVAGDLVEVQRLLVKGPHLLKSDLKGGASALHWAARAGKISIVNHLLDVGLDVKKEDADGMTPLHEAARAGHVAVVERLVDRHADVHAKTERGSTPLYLAIRDGHLDTARLLKKLGADVNEGTYNQWSPLLAACQRGTPQTVAWLLAQGADSSVPGPHGFTALHMAARNTAHPGVLDELGQKMPHKNFLAMANKADKWGTTPVERAAEHGQSAAVIDKLRLTRVPPPVAFVPTTYQRGLIVVGPDLGHWDFLKTIAIGAETGIKMHTYGGGRTRLSWKAFQAQPVGPGDFAVAMLHTYWNNVLGMVMVMFGEGKEVPLLDMVCVWLRKGVVRIFLTGCDAARAMPHLKSRLELDPGRHWPGLDITLVGAGGTIPIGLNKAAMDLWIDDGAMKRKHGVEGKSLYRRGVQQMHSLAWDASQKALVMRTRDVLKVGDLNALEPDEAAGAKADLLSLYVFENNLAEVKSLVLDHKANVLLRDDRGMDIFFMACALGHLEIARFLLEQPGVELDHQLPLGGTALWVVCEKGFTALVKLLLEKGANPALGENSESAMAVALRRNRHEIVELLKQPRASTPTV